MSISPAYHFLAMSITDEPIPNHSTSSVSIDVVHTDADVSKKIEQGESGTSTSTKESQHDMSGATAQIDDVEEDEDQDESNFPVEESEHVIEKDPSASSVGSIDAETNIFRLVAKQQQQLAERRQQSMKQQQQLIVLASLYGSGNRESFSQQNNTFTILKGSLGDDIPFLIIDGSDPENYPQRDALLEISGIGHVYPQFFIAKTRVTSLQESFHESFRAIMDQNKTATNNEEVTTVEGSKDESHGEDPNEITKEKFDHELTIGIQLDDYDDIQFFGDYQDLFSANEQQMLRSAFLNQRPISKNDSCLVHFDDEDMGEVDSITSHDQEEIVVEVASNAETVNATSAETENVCIAPLSTIDVRQARTDANAECTANDRDIQGNINVHEIVEEIMDEFDDESAGNDPSSTSFTSGQFTAIEAEAEPTTTTDLANVDLTTGEEKEHEELEAAPVVDIKNTSDVDDIADEIVDGVEGTSARKDPSLTTISSIQSGNAVSRNVVEIVPDINEFDEGKAVDRVDEVAEEQKNPAEDKLEREIFAVEVVRITQERQQKEEEARLEEERLTAEKGARVEPERVAAEGAIRIEEAGNTEGNRQQEEEEEEGALSFENTGNSSVSKDKNEAAAPAPAATEADAALDRTREIPPEEPSERTTEEACESQKVPTSETAPDSKPDVDMDTQEEPFTRLPSSNLIPSTAEVPTNTTLQMPPLTQALSKTDPELFPGLELPDWVETWMILPSNPVAKYVENISRRTTTDKKIETTKRITLFLRDGEEITQSRSETEEA